MDDLSGVHAPVDHSGRKGFLPIETNTFDRVFISVVVWVAIHQLWMRILEVYLPLWIASIICFILAIIIIRKG